MMDYFDFNVGDLFEYHGKKTSGALPQQVIYVRKYEIMAKVVSGDTVRYSVDSYEVDTNYSTVPFPPVTTVSVTYSGLQHYDLMFIDSADHFGNKFNNQPISQLNRGYESFEFYGFPVSLMGLYDTSFYRCHLFLDSNSLNCIQLGSISDYRSFYGEPYYSGSIVPYTFSDTLMPIGMSNSLSWNDLTEGMTVTLKEGLGQTFINWSSHFEHMWGEKLWAYRKGNDTVGVFSAQNLFDGINEPGQTLNVHVFPNPSSGTFTVQLPANTIASIEILDLQGRIVKTFANQSGQISLQADDLADGVYLLQISAPEGKAQQKIVIRH
jgi:hypothetical protein